MKYVKFVFIVLMVPFMISSYGQSDLILSPDSLYNLGNQSFNEKRYDEAIYNYEKARLLDPGSDDIKVNLRLANEKLSTDIIELEPFFLARWWNSFSELLLPGGWKMFSVIILAMTIVLLYLYFFKSKPGNKNLFYLLMGSLVFTFLLSVLAGNKRYNTIFNSPYVIVFGSELQLHEGPDAVSDEVKQLTGGNKLRILDEDGEWYKVSAMDNEQGWIKKQNVRLIGFSK